MIKLFVGMVGSVGALIMGFAMITLLFFMTLINSFGPYNGGGGYGVGGGVPLTPGPRPGHVIRIVQTDSNQYKDTQEWETWKNSTCSAASLAAALDTLGYNVRITDVMARFGSGQITVDGGLQSTDYLVNVGKSFGAPVVVNYGPSYEDLKIASNNHYLMLVSIITPYFKYGHWVLISYVDDNGVTVTDPWPSNIQGFTKDGFLSIWRGYVVIIKTPFY